jgi:hypothetical protein
MKHLATWALALLLGAVAFGCGDDDSSSVCDNGETQPCTCTDGNTGAQSCLNDGSGWSECECTGGDTDTDTGTDADTDSDADTDTDTDSDTDSDSDGDAPDCADGHGKLDVNTNLCWQHPEAGGKYEWQDANDYCDTLSLGGYDDWHLPSGEEFAEMLGDCDDDILINPSVCNSCNDSEACVAMFGLDDWDIYWSSSLYSSNLAWYVYFYEGYFNYYYFDYDILVRCVRQES